MIPKLNRGLSFKKLTAYLMHDKREDGAEAGEPYPDTAERVGFTCAMNFHGDAAQGDPTVAGRIMALTWQSREALKSAAGIKPGGSEAEAPPVWHTSLSWAKSERPDEAEMMRAVEAYLKHQGLGLEKGYQTYVVQHTDTEHPHVHIVVNLVHPEHGRQANPYRDQQKAQAWARSYEKQRGQVFCTDREAKYAELDVARAQQASAGQARAAFNDSAQGAPVARQDSFGRSRRRPRKSHTRPEWQARQRAGGDNRAGQEAADRLKTGIAAKYAGLRSGREAAFTQRTAETARLHADRRAGREAIYEKYRTALEAVWTPQPGPRHAIPDRSHLWESVHRQQAQRQATFDANEKTALGRVRNAVALAGRGSVFKVARLAVNQVERKRLFERGQREIVANVMPRQTRPASRPTPKTPEPKRVQAARLKAMRTAELTAHNRDTVAQAASLHGRHAFQIAAEKDARTMLAKDAKASWRQHEAAHGVGKPQIAKPEKELRPEAVRPAPDRFGRSRDRQPRAPRTRRGEHAGKAGSESVAAVPASNDRGAENSPVERGYLSGQFPAPEQQTPHQAQAEAVQQQNLGQGQQDGQTPVEPTEKTWTPEEWEAALEAERRAREERDQGHESDPGRTL